MIIVLLSFTKMTRKKYDTDDVKDEYWDIEQVENEKKEQEKFEKELEEQYNKETTLSERNSDELYYLYENINYNFYTLNLKFTDFCDFADNNKILKNKDYYGVLFWKKENREELKSSYRFIKQSKLFSKTTYDDFVNFCYSKK